MGGVIRNFNKYRSQIEDAYNGYKNTDNNPLDFSEKDRTAARDDFQTRFSNIRNGRTQNPQETLDTYRINIYQRVANGILNPELEQYRAFLRDVVEKGSHGLNNQENPKLQDQNYAKNYRSALSRTDRNVGNFFAIQDKQDGVGQTFNVKDHDLMRDAEKQLQQVMPVGGNRSEQGQRLAQAFYTNKDSSGMPTMRLPEMIAAMNYSQTLGDKEAEQFKAGFFEGMANFIKQNRGFTPAQFMNTMANVYNNLDWGGADVNGKDETSKNLGQLQGFLGELTGGVAKEFGFKKGMIGGYDDGTRGATALVLGDDGKVEFQTVREGSVLAKSRLLWEGDGSNAAALNDNKATGNGSAPSEEKDIQSQLTKAIDLLKDPSATSEDLAKTITALSSAFQSGLSGVDLNNPQAIKDAIEHLETQAKNLKDGDPAKSLLNTQIEGLNAQLTELNSAKPKAAKPSEVKKDSRPPLDLNYVKKNLNNYEVHDLAKDKDYIPNEADIELARKNPDTHFARGITNNPNFNPSETDASIALNKPYTLFAGGVGSNPNFTPKPDDLITLVARSYPVSNLANGLAENPNYQPIEADIKAAKSKPNTVYADGLLSKQSYEPTHADIAFAIEHPDTLFAGGLARNPNYKPTEADIKFANNNKDTLFTEGLAKNPNHKTVVASTTSVADEVVGS